MTYYIGLVCIMGPFYSWTFLDLAKLKFKVTNCTANFSGLRKDQYEKSSPVRLSYVRVEQSFRVLNSSNLHEIHLPLGTWERTPR